MFGMFHQTRMVEVLLMQVQLYCHMKALYYDNFMVWAFGINWRRLTITKLIQEWNQRHPTLKSVNDKEQLLPTILSMIDWYIQVGKNTPQ